MRTVPYLVLAAGVAAFFWAAHNDRILTRLVESALNHYVAGPVPWEVRSVRSEGSLFNLPFGRTYQLDFEGVRPKDSANPGIRGTLSLAWRRGWRIRLEKTIEGLDLSELVWLNPENLSGSEGLLTGEVTAERESGGEIRFRAILRVKEPGGKIPAHLFEALRPYLPQAALEGKVDTVTQAGGRVGFREAAVRAALAETDRMKTFLHLEVPEYNLVLNLNLEVKVDEKEGLWELMNLIKKLSGPNAA